MAAGGVAKSFHAESAGDVVLRDDVVHRRGAGEVPHHRVADRDRDRLRREPQRDVVDADRNTSLRSRRPRRRLRTSRPPPPMRGDRGLDAASSSVSQHHLLPSWNPTRSVVHRPEDRANGSVTARTLPAACPKACDIRSRWSASLSPAPLRNAPGTRGGGDHGAEVERRTEESRSRYRWWRRPPVPWLRRPRKPATCSRRSGSRALSDGPATRGPTGRSAAGGRSRPGDAPGVRVDRMTSRRQTPHGRRAAADAGHDRRPAELGRPSAGQPFTIKQDQQKPYTRLHFFGATRRRLGRRRRTRCASPTARTETVNVQLPGLVRHPDHSDGTSRSAASRAATPPAAAWTARSARSSTSRRHLGRERGQDVRRARCRPQTTQRR